MGQGSNGASSAVTDREGTGDVSRRRLLIGAGAAGVIGGIAGLVPGAGAGEARAAGCEDCFVSVKDYGAVGDGATDDTSAFQEAILAAAGSGVVFVPGGTYNLEDTVTPNDDTSGIVVMGAGPAVTVLKHLADGKPLLSTGATKAYFSSSVPFTASASIGDTSITISSTSGLTAGDLVVLADPTAPIKGNTKNETVALSGEVAKVKSVDSSTDLTFHGMLEFNYSTSATLQRRNDVDGFHLSDLTIRNPNPSSMSAASRGVTMHYTKNVHISNVRFVDLDEDGIQLYSTVDFCVKDCRFDNLQADWGLNPYSINTSRASQNGLIHGCVQRGGYCLTTFGGGTSDIAPSHISVSDCTAANMTASAFHTHPGSRWISFIDCQAHTSAERGFQIRGPDSAVINPTVSGAAIGVRFIYGADRGRLVGGRLAKCDTGVSVFASSEVSVTDTHIDNCDVGINVDTGSHWPTMTGLLISDCYVDADTRFSWDHWDSTFELERIRTPDDLSVKPSLARAETVDRSSVYSIDVASEITAFKSGELYLVAISLVAGQRFASVMLYVKDDAGTPSHLWTALYDRDLNLIQVTDDQGSGATTNEGIWQFDFDSPVIASYTGLHYIGICSVASTPITSRGLKPHTGVAGIEPVLAGSSTSGLSNPASAPDPAAAPTVSANMPYIYLQ